MEELQSTEILDREILEDARKKASRILKTCEDTIYTQNAKWDKKTKNSIIELNKKYDKQKENEAEKIMSRLPIDKLRAKIEKIESLLHTAIKDWYNNLNRSQIIGILSRDLSNKLTSCKNFSLNEQTSIETQNLTPNETQTIIESLNNHSTLNTTHSTLVTTPYPSIILESGNIRFTSSIESILDHLLQEKRAELAEALLGRDIMENI
ncbi:MAG: hypothetical protein FWD13_06205 [Treponema sp.]|nr:hypothetical protein [Treponema sp.]